MMIWCAGALFAASCLSWMPIQDHPFPAGAGGPRVDLGLFGMPSEELFRTAARDWARSDDERETCEALIRRWAIAERDADAREFARLRAAEQRLAAHRSDPGGWRANPEAVSLYEESVRERQRANARRTAREAALLDQLCGACGRDASDADSVKGRIAAWRGAALPVPIEGGCVDLAPLVEGNGENQELVADAVDRYLAEMQPIWNQKLRARARQLEANAEVVAGTAAPGATFSASRDFLDASMLVATSNRRWATVFASILHPANGDCEGRIAAADRLRSAALQRSPSGIPIDCDDESVRGLVIRQWRQLAELVEEQGWWSAADAVYPRLCGSRLLGPSAAALSAEDPATKSARLAEVHQLALDAVDAPGSHPSGAISK